tara:strand:+ start:162 stop:518 length:357 start_codon:yes stop_codon:yes gene_type:complete
MIFKDICYLYSFSSFNNKTHKTKEPNNASIEINPGLTKRKIVEEKIRKPRLKYLITKERFLLFIHKKISFTKSTIKIKLIKTIVRNGYPSIGARPNKNEILKIKKYQKYMKIRYFAER